MVFLNILMKQKIILQQITNESNREQVFIPFLKHNSIYCGIAILASIYFKDVARTLVQ